MNRKSVASVEWKDAGAGTFRARFSTIDVVDSDMDVVFPGAFQDGKQVPISACGQESWMGALPVGKGTASSDKKGAYIDGAFFLNTTPGRDTYETVKALGDLQEWSYGYEVLQATFDQEALKEFPGALRGLIKVAVHEVSPVLKGAGVDTVTQMIKAAGGAGDLPLADRARGWDAGAARAEVTSWAAGDWSKYSRAFFWHDSAATDQAGSYKLGFATVDGGTLIAVPRGIFAAAAAMQGSRGGVQIPDGDRGAVRARIAADYAKMPDKFSDDSIVPPWDDTGKSLSLATHAEAVLADSDALRAPPADRAEVRPKEGRRLSSATRDGMGAIHQSLMDCAAG